MPIEIERKFYVTDPVDTWPIDVLACSAAEIRQGYLTPPGATPEVRLRKAREVAFETAHAPVPRSRAGATGVHTVEKMAVKGDIPTTDAGAISRHEVEFDLDTASFAEAWRLTEGRRVRKVRVSYTLRLTDDRVLAISVDTFRDHLAGLTLAEIEFAEWMSSVAFDAPGFLGLDVTHDERFRNAALAAAPGPPTPK